MLTRFAKNQLLVFSALTVSAALVLGLYFLRVPAVLGIGEYTLHVHLPRTGGLYKTANVTYQGVTIGTVTAVDPTDNGARATLQINDDYQIPVDARAEVHSASAVGEQYVELVSPDHPNRYLSDGETISASIVPTEIGPTLDAVNNALGALPADKIPGLLDESAKAVGGLGPALQRLVRNTHFIVGDIKTNINDINAIIDESGPLLHSQAVSANTIPAWAANLNNLAAQADTHDPAVREILNRAGPTLQSATEFFRDVGDALPQTLANTEIVLDMLKRYHPNLEQILVVLPQLASVSQAVLAPDPTHALLDFNFAINQPPPCLTGFLPASEWRSPADTSAAPIPANAYCKIPKDAAANVVRGARNYPCADVPGKRAATPSECRSAEPYQPEGTNPWYGNPNQVLNCPAPAARCDQPPEPGRVIPAPSVNNGTNPLPADQLPNPPVQHSDPLTPVIRGSVQCNGQPPNSCTYTPSSDATAVYDPAAGRVTGIDGTPYRVTNSLDDPNGAWQAMLAPARP